MGSYTPLYYDLFVPMYRQGIATATLATWWISFRAQAVAWYKHCLFRPHSTDLHWVNSCKLWLASCSLSHGWLSLQKEASFVLSQSGVKDGHCKRWMILGGDGFVLPRSCLFSELPDWQWYQHYPDRGLNEWDTSTDQTMGSKLD